MLFFHSSVHSEGNHKHKPSFGNKGQSVRHEASFIVQTSPLALEENTRTREHKLDFFCIRKLICVTD